MKVLSFSYCFPSSQRPTWGVFVLQRLAALGHLVDLEVASPHPNFPVWSRLRGGRLAPVEEHGGLTVHYPRWLYVPGMLKTLDGRFYARGIRRWFEQQCRRQRPDLLDAHFVWPDGVGVSHLARRAGLPYVITLRGWLYPCLERASLRRQARRALLDAAGVISVSGHLADTAADLGVPRDRIHVIPNGVDVDRFRPLDRDRARRELGLPTDGPLIVAVAHLKRTKGHDELIEALAALPYEVSLVIVGEDPGRGAYRRHLEDLISRLGLQDRVLLAGRQPHERIPLYLSAADVGVLASYREGCPNVVLESLACGTPVVATRVGAVPDLIQPRVGGEIVPPRDSAALGDGLREVLEQPWSREAIRASVRGNTWEVVAERVLAVFRHVLGQPEGASSPGEPLSDRPVPGPGPKSKRPLPCSENG